MRARRTRTLTARRSQRSNVDARARSTPAARRSAAVSPRTWRTRRWRRTSRRSPAQLETTRLEVEAARGQAEAARGQNETVKGQAEALAAANARLATLDAERRARRRWSKRRRADRDRLKAMLDAANHAIEDMKGAADKRVALDAQRVRSLQAAEERTEAILRERDTLAAELAAAMQAAAAEDSEAARQLEAARAGAEALRAQYDAEHAVVLDLRGDLEQMRTALDRERRADGRGCARNPMRSVSPRHARRRRVPRTPTNSRSRAPISNRHARLAPSDGSKSTRWRRASQR